MKTTKLMKRIAKAILVDDTNKHAGVTLRTRPYCSTGADPVGSNAQVQSFYHEKLPKHKLRRRQAQTSRAYTNL